MRGGLLRERRSVGSIFVGFPVRQAVPKLHPSNLVDLIFLTSRDRPCSDGPLAIRREFSSKGLPEL
jgi:hypothetical protein